MELRTYYRLSLLLVPAVLAISLLMDWLSPAYWVVAFAGPQYLVFSLLIFIVIGKIKSDQLLCLLLYSAPIVFLPFEFLGFALIGSGDEHIPFNVAQTFLGLAGPVLLIGYPVVLIVDMMRVLAQRVGVVK